MNRIQKFKLPIANENGTIYREMFPIAAMRMYKRMRRNYYCLRNIGLFRQLVCQHHKDIFLYQVVLVRDIR